MSQRDRTLVGGRGEQRLRDIEDKVTRSNENLIGVPRVKGMKQGQYSQQFLFKLSKTKKRSSKYPRILINSK